MRRNSKAIVAILMTVVQLVSTVTMGRPGEYGPVKLVTDVLVQDIKKKTETKGFNDHPDNIFLTLAPDVPALGPVLPRKDPNNKNIETSEQDYIRWLFRELVKGAHELIYDQGEFGYSETAAINAHYYGFLILALTVPHHESHLVHFRSTEGRRCFQVANSFAKVPAPSSKRAMIKNYRSSVLPLMPDCRFLQNQPIVNQVINSHNYEDVGVMQINPRSHTTAIQPEVLLNTKRFIDYGLSYLLDQYLSIKGFQSKNKRPYPCGLSSDPYGVAGTTRSAQSYNIVRESWSKYNGGSGTYCRLQKPNHPFHKNDKGFKTSLDSIILGSTSIYHRYLPEESLERHAFQEIVNNFKRIYLKVPGKEENENLKVLLGRSTPGEQRVSYWAAPQRSSYEPTHVVKSKKVTLYHSMIANMGASCGYIDGRNQGSGIMVRVERETLFDLKGKRWAAVRVPKYNDSVVLMSQWTEVKLRPIVRASELRMAVGSHNDVFVGQLLPGQKLEYIDSTVVNGVEWYRVQKDRFQYYILASNVTKTVVQGPPATQCLGDYFYIADEDLRHLPIEYQRGTKFEAVVNGVGTLLVRRSPSTQSDTIGQVRASDTIRVIGDDQRAKSGNPSWYQILLPDGQTGYIQAPRIDLIRKVID